MEDKIKLDEHMRVNKIDDFIREQRKVRNIDGRTNMQKYSFYLTNSPIYSAWEKNWLGSDQWGQDT